MGLKGIKAMNDVTITPTFTEHSFSIKIDNFNGRNYEFSIVKTGGKIIPDWCKIKIKTNCIFVSMHKWTSSRWDHLHFVEEI